MRRGAVVEGSVGVQDPVDGGAAVLVQRYNITQQKQLELQLSLQQEALQRSASNPHPCTPSCPQVPLLLQLYKSATC